LNDCSSRAAAPLLDARCDWPCAVTAMLILLLGSASGRRFYSPARVPRERLSVP
jgi:hypothetical protein